MLTYGKLGQRASERTQGTVSGPAQGPAPELSTQWEGDCGRASSGPETDASDKAGWWSTLSRVPETQDTPSRRAGTQYDRHPFPKQFSTLETLTL